MKDILEKFLYNASIILVVICWLFMGVYLFEKIKKGNKK